MHALASDALSMAQPLQLSVFATIAPLLPVTECGKADLFEALVDRLVADGYEGIEAQVSQILLIGVARFAAKLHAARIKFIGKVYSSGGPSAVPSEAGVSVDMSPTGIVHPRQGRSVGEHVAVWVAQLEECCTPALRPLLVSVSSQGGRDLFHRNGGAEALEFLSRCGEAEARLGVRVHHETHRHRVLFNPWAAVEAVRALPGLHLLADLSHYCVVTEAPCGEVELEEAVAELLPRVGHIHARVGFEEGPQVPDPRMPRFAPQLEGHARWWAAAFLHTRDRGAPLITVTPEWLPAPYCWTTTGREGGGSGSSADPLPVADVYEINVWIAAYVRALFARTVAA